MNKNFVLIINFIIFALWLGIRNVITWLLISLLG